MKISAKYCFCFLLLFLYFIKADAQLTANFTASPVSGCAPINVHFTDASTGSPASWYWDFGNGTTSTAQNPSVTFSDAGTYDVRLIVRNASEENYIEKTGLITVYAKPEVSFGQDVSSGCLPLTVNFTNTSISNGANIATWSWNFGDGAKSNSQSTSHIYTSHGVFDVSLIAVTDKGCTDTFAVTSAVKAGNKPGSVSFKANPLTGCASALRNFTDMSTGNINSWSWNFGDGGTSSSKNPVYHYTDTGFFSVKLVAADNGCKDSAELKNYIHVSGPVAKIRKVADCSNPNQLNFYDVSIGSQTRKWDFGDAGTSTDKNDLHTYATTGIYTVKLKVFEGSCDDTTSLAVYVINQNPSYTINPAKNIYCRNDSIDLLATNYDADLVSYFSWSFDGGATRTPYRADANEIKNIYTKNGKYPAPILYVYDKENCVDTIQKSQISIAGPFADFAITPGTCLGTPVSFTDQSVSANTILNRKWNFGDGDSVVTAAAQTSYQYSFPGRYNVFFKVTDVNGCADTISHSINIIKTPAIDAGNDTTICAGKSVVLQPSGGTTYNWNNNAFLSCTNCANPSANPSSSTVFYVTGTNNGGCSATDSVIVNVIQKEQLVVTPATQTICAGSSVQLSASGYDSYTWQPSTSLNDANIANPVASPQQNTLYTVTATDKSGCFTQTASVNIIANPKPTAVIADTNITVQPGEPYQINPVYSANVVKWQWQPEQWLNNANIANPVATPLQTTTYSVYASTINGCVAVSTITVTVLCNNTVVFIPNTFSPNGDGMNDYFFPRSKSSIQVKSFRIFNRWGQEIFVKTNFASNDQLSGWDGKYKGAPQQSDVYIYMMQLSCSNGNIFNEKGSVTLIR